MRGDQMSEVDNVEKEMNRGFIQLVVLLLLEKPMYGYMIVRVLEQNGVLVDENTLYPLLRRLEEKGALSSRWDAAEAKARKYYEVTDQGRALRGSLLEIWQQQGKAIEALRREVES
jgi:PadR family transcriptional regulator PadR